VAAAPPARPGSLGREPIGSPPLRYYSQAETNVAIATQIVAQSPSDNIKAAINAAPLVSGRAAPLADRLDRDGPSRALRWSEKQEYMSNGLVVLCH
jgi:hypothetical protein